MKIDKNLLEPKPESEQSEQKKLLLNRMNRLLGQLQGVKRMLENDDDYTNIVIQISAVRAALNSLNKEIICDNVQNSFYETLNKGDDSKLKELIATMERILK